jgi:hypothetical protein
MRLGLEADSHARSGGGSGIWHAVYLHQNDAPFKGGSIPDRRNSCSPSIPRLSPTGSAGRAGASMGEPPDLKFSPAMSKYDIFRAGAMRCQM